MLNYKLYSKCKFEHFTDKIYSQYAFIRKMSSQINHDFLQEKVQNALFFI